MANLQDLIFALGSVIFIIALVPSIRGADKPAFSSSVMTGTILTVFAATYLTFDHPLWFASVTTFITAGCWFTLAVQKYQQRNPAPYISPNVPWHWEGSD